MEKKNQFKLDGKGISVLVFSFLFIALLLGLVVDFSLKYFNEDLTANMFFNLLSYPVIFVFPIFCFEFFKLKPENKKLFFNLSPKDFQTYVLIFPMMFGMMLVSEFFTSLVPIEGKYLGDLYQKFSLQMNFLISDQFATIVLTVLFAPIIEEIIFRGIIQKGLLNKVVKPWKAILISAFFFGLVHGNPWQFIGAVLLGSVLGLVYYKTKSLLLPILLHAFNNLVSSLLIFYASTDSFGTTFKISEIQILGVGVVLFAVFFILFLKKYPERLTQI